VNKDTGTRYSGETSSAGVYYMAYVLPGTYKVTVTAAGFRSAVQDNVLLVAAQYYGLNFKSANCLMRWFWMFATRVITPAACASIIL
jgi:hypothetical protein